MRSLTLPPKPLPSSSPNRMLLLLLLLTLRWITPSSEQREKKLLL